MDPFHIAEKQRKTIKKTNTQNLQEKDEITSGSQNSTRNSEEFQHVFHVHPIPNGPLDPFFLIQGTIGSRSRTPPRLAESAVQPRRCRSWHLTSFFEAMEWTGLLILIDAY
jgi:hypothetical protein